MTRTLKLDEPLKAELSRRFNLQTVKACLGLVDYLTLLYLAIVTILIILFQGDNAIGLTLVGVNLVGMLVLVLFIYFADSSSSRVVRLVRDCYPVIIYTFLFKEVATVINMIFPFWLEQHLIELDRFLFRTNPTVWLERLRSPWFTELMAFSYWSYYIILPGTTFFLYFQEDRSLFLSYIFHLSLTLYICYLSYLFLTARGPHETLVLLHTPREIVGFFDNMVKIIQNRASISGAAFPSSHVTAVWIAWIFLYKYKRAIGYAFLPLILALTFSVVYMQYHYAVDPIAGILLVCLSYPFGRYLEERFSYLQRSAA